MQILQVKTSGYDFLLLQIIKEKTIVLLFKSGEEA